LLPLQVVIKQNHVTPDGAKPFESVYGTTAPPVATPDTTYTSMLVVQVPPKAKSDQKVCSYGHKRLNCGISQLIQVSTCHRPTLHDNRAAPAACFQVWAIVSNPHGPAECFYEDNDKCRDS
jgi:hypothetical protein